MKIVFLLTIQILLIALYSGVYAQPVDFNQCAANPDHHCYVYMTQRNTGNSTNPNWHFTAVFPQNEAPQVDAIVSNGNWTAWKNDIAVMWVGNIYTTSHPVTSNFCPPSLLSLVHQDGYLYKFYNKTSSFDNTSLIYPVYCHAETGPNPINGDATVPEFPFAVPVLLVGMISLIVFHRLKFTNKRA